MRACAGGWLGVMFVCCLYFGLFVYVRVSACLLVSLFVSVCWCILMCVCSIDGLLV